MVLDDYILPFNSCGDVNIIQGFNGGFSHRKIRSSLDQSFSLDFALGYGTDVIAVRDGVVINSFMGDVGFYGGLDFNEAVCLIGNFVEILHDDGSIAHYQHLDSSEPAVYEGFRICQGSFIGRTGKSGWVGPIPHLHFMVYDKVGINKVTKRINFSNYSGFLDDCLIN